MLENLENLYFIQVTSGCDQIQCTNTYCFNCPEFRYSNLITESYENEVAIAQIAMNGHNFQQNTNDQSESNTNNFGSDPRYHQENSIVQQFKEIAALLAKNHKREPHLCVRFQPYVKRALSRMSNHHIIPDKDEWNEKKFFQYIMETEESQFIAKDLIINTRKMFTDINTFSTIFMANEIPLSLLNSAIDDELLYHFSTKISSIHILSACLLDCVTQIAKIIINDHGVKSFDPLSPNPSPFAPKIEAKNSYSVIRSLCLLFYFPSIMNHGILKSILHPLLKVFNTLPQTSSKVFISWVSRLNNLRRQIIGACHFYISMYFAEISKPDIHSNDIHHVLEALNVIHFANSLSEHPFPAQLFYNHHIDESFDVEKEVNYFMNRSPQSNLIAQHPFILSLKTKSQICQNVSQRNMLYMAFRSLFIDALNSRPSTDLFLTIQIRRDHLLEDAINELSMHDKYSFLKKLKVVFQGESAVDVGGPSREFFYLISESLFSPNYGMFVLVNHDQYNWFSQLSFENERSFFLVGAIVGLAVHNSIVLPIRFPLVVYKRLLRPQEQLNLADLAQIDPELAKNLKQIIEMASHNEDISQLDLTFAITVNYFDQIRTIPLVNSSNMETFLQQLNSVYIPFTKNLFYPLTTNSFYDENTPVTNNNVLIYVKAYIFFMLIGSIETNFEAFREGFEHVCYIEEYKILEPEEFDILVSGEEVLDWGALQRCATYSDGYSSKSRAVKWFWDLFQRLSNGDKLKFLKFATGTDRAPVGGLGKLKLVIQRGADPDKLPVSHTCFNTFTLPDYRTRQELEKKVTLAIEQNEGFGIV